MWEYTTENNLVIVSKDTDFSDRMILHDPPPKVIHIRFGNMKMKQFFVILNKFWKDAVSLLEENKLIAIYEDHVEAIS